jgi:hypothetical protein
MDVWRIGLLVASVVFLAFLVARLRPRLSESSEERASDQSPAEDRLWKRLRKLPLPAQRRILQRLREALRTAPPGNDSGQDAVD